MKYMLSIYGNDELWASYSEERFASLIAADAAFQKEIRESGELVSVEGLADSVKAKTVRVRDGLPVVTDGPYLRSKDYLASYFVVDCESLDRAIELAARYPAARDNGVEVRPLMNQSGTEI
ncbi:YciI family protein [Planotetraspora sp. A-T 1434]|uniref:YciI family protein n=1 Tax=Planotetraspora sp. A-T 1434 TaxID=2979219 RepID=UPI0021C1CE9D|nr:YciI family protein [Planotetraspora sp. A-T 1434]MCT9931833.1 YciI family protein [Planotetraspora sp. A-T 1434]